MSRSRIRVLGLALAIPLAFVLYFVLRQDDAARARAPIDRVKSALAYDSTRETPAMRSARIERELEASVEPDVMVSIPEAQRMLSGRTAAFAFAADAHDLRRLELAVTDTVVSFDAKRETAHLTARFAVDAWLSDYESHQVRNASIVLVRRGKSWSISSLTVAPRTHEEPEARP